MYKLHEHLDGIEPIHLVSGDDMQYFLMKKTKWKGTPMYTHFFYNSVADKA